MVPHPYYCKNSFLIPMWNTLNPTVTLSETHNRAYSNKIASTALKSCQQHHKYTKNIKYTFVTCRLLGYK
jgi:hypothetical protein